MTTKLTLTVDHEVIEKAKAYAQEKNKSVSRIVEDYLRHISTGTVSTTFSDSLKSSITDTLVGIINDPGTPYEVMLSEALEEKFE